MKKFILSLLVLFIFCSRPAIAKDVSLEVEFEMDAEAALTVTEYQLLVIKDTEKELVATIPVVDHNVRVFTADAIEIPPGRSLDWFLHAIYQSGDVGISPAYPFKIIGRPTIKMIIRLL